jgi:hypothetical protein
MDLIPRQSAQRDITHAGTFAPIGAFDGFTSSTHSVDATSHSHDRCPRPAERRATRELFDGKLPIRAVMDVQRPDCRPSPAPGSTREFLRSRYVMRARHDGVIFDDEHMGLVDPPTFPGVV